MSRSSKLKSSCATTDRGTSWMKLGLGVLIILTVSVNWCESKNTRPACLGGNYVPCKHKLKWTKEGCYELLDAYFCRVDKLSKSQCHDEMIFKLGHVNMVEVFTENRDNVEDALSCLNRKAREMIMPQLILANFKMINNKNKDCLSSAIAFCGRLKHPTGKTLKDKACKIFRGLTICIDQILSSKCMAVEGTGKTIAGGKPNDYEKGKRAFQLQAKLMGVLLHRWKCAAALKDAQVETALKKYGLLKGAPPIGDEELQKLITDLSTSRAPAHVSTWWGVLAPLGLACLLLKAL